MQMARQFIYLLFLKNIYLWLFHSAAGKSPNSHIVLPPPLGPCKDKPSCSSCQLLLHCWKWKCVPLGLVSARVPCHLFISGVQVHDGEMVCFVRFYLSLLLPRCCCFILGEQTGTPVSETHQACG